MHPSGDDRSLRRGSKAIDPPRVTPFSKANLMPKCQQEQPILFIDLTGADANRHPDGSVLFCGQRPPIRTTTSLTGGDGSPIFIVLKNMAVPRPILPEGRFLRFRGWRAAGAESRNHRETTFFLDASPISRVSVFYAAESAPGGFRPKMWTSPFPIGGRDRESRLGSSGLIRPARER